MSNELNKELYEFCKAVTSGCVVDYPLHDCVLHAEALLSFYGKEVKIIEKDGLSSRLQIVWVYDHAKQYIQTYEGV